MRYFYCGIGTRLFFKENLHAVFGVVNLVHNMSTCKVMEIIL